MDYKFLLRQTGMFLLTPVRAWTSYLEQKQSVKLVRNNILLPFLLLVAICSFLGSFLLANTTMQPLYSVFVALRYVLLDIVVVYLSAVIYREIAKALDLNADFQLSFGIMVYSLLPLFICQMASLLFESLVFIYVIALYGLWILWYANVVTLNPPAHKKIPMVIAVFVVIAELYVGCSLALASLVDRIYFGFFA